MLYFEMSIVVVLVVVNGLLALSELAVVSARPARLKAMADRGVRGARRALALSSNPGRFLSTVQIGITLVGVLSGAFSGATLGLRLTQWLAAAGLPPSAADTLGVGSVVLAITYASLIAGELVPKQIALRDPEKIAARVAPAMTLLARVASPLVTVIDGSGKILLKLLGQREDAQEKVTDEEIRTIIAEAENVGVIEADERRMINGVMRLGDRPVIGVMTPRTDVDWIDLCAPLSEQLELLAATPHSRLPAGESVDDLLGVVQARELLASALASRPLDIRAHIRAAPVIHDTADALDVLAVLKTAAVPMALVHDEYGHFEGIVTPADILEAITGSFRADTDADDTDPPAIRREDGSWLLAGYLPADEMAEHLGLALPEHRGYQTVAGFVTALFRRLPATGEFAEAMGWRFEIVDTDQRKIDKVLAARTARP